MDKGQLKDVGEDVGESDGRQRGGNGEGEGRKGEISPTWSFLKFGTYGEHT